ncbi:cytochrome b N-terminal domain-containing protein [Pedosphaera parvula]|uniref:Cytochrome b/b6 domain protein n=1 Tax=Pedosphaera parvula (strain Ellin514) TaxID=320771 RepID=B9XS39_PEDPL|nr:cytochrome b N-terminal domain-containing protein [Pedosphaera parvula]EEF57335.1 Cytochrome b/b6 domain protein [Pedosphaera parvula Ellin514]
MKVLIDWVDSRTGVKKLTHEALYENVPGGSRWRYVWGSTLTFAIAVQFITGIFLWMGYAPSAQTAWESVNFIQNETTGGWLLRGIHHYTAQCMTVLLLLHLMQVVIDGAYKAPREVNFWFGILLMQLVLGLSLTGYLLPWDQKGFWATKVATNILSIVPFVGHDLQRLVLGGADYGHLTLTRFFALHAGVLPASLIILLAGHIYLFRKHGIKSKEPHKASDTAFWPDQVLKDAVACLAVMATVLFLILRYNMFGTHGPVGAELGAPADPSEPYSAARPDWYFLFLFQFLKFFPGQTEIIGAIIIPSLAMLVIFLMPFIGRWKLGHRFNVGFLFAVLAGAGLLTYMAMAEDKHNDTYKLAVKQADRDAERVKELARSSMGIPPTGAVTLLRNDPLTQGPKLFAKNCSSCHRYDGGDGMGNQVKDAQSASDLKGFGSREWLGGLLDPARVDSTNYFGGTKFKEGKMVKFVKKKVAGYSPEEKEQLRKVIAAVSADAGLKAQKAIDEHDAANIAEGRTLIKTAMACTDCHQFHSKDEDATAPDLTGYASKEWLVKFISNPGHPSFYGDRNDRMPAFGEKQILNEQQIGMISDWLRGDWYEPIEAAKR